MSRLRYSVRLGLLGSAFCALGFSSLWAGAIGMVADNVTKSVTVFDADTDTVIGSVFLPQSPTASSATGDCVITTDQTLGFVTDFQFRVWVIDLEASPPALAGGTNPIPVGNRAEDLVLTPDGKYLLACDGSNSQPLVLIDLSTRTQVAAYNTGSDCNCVDVCPDGTILAGSVNQQRIHRLLIDDSGPTPVFVATGDSFPLGANNVYGCPSSAVGVVIRGNDEVVSFTLPDMTIVDRRPLTGRWGVAGVFSADGKRLFVRSVNFGNLTGFVDVFEIDPFTGEMSLDPVLAFPIAGSPPDVPANRVQAFFGMDQIALGPDEDKVYVPERNFVSIYDPNTGVLIDQFDSPNAIVGATGICIQDSLVISLLVDIKPDSDVNPLNLRSKGVLPIAILSTDDFDALSIDTSTLLVGDPLLGGSAVPIEKETSEDVNFDGLPDLLIFVDVEELVLGGAADEQSVALVVTGETVDGDPVLGGDYVWIVPGSSNGNQK